MPPLSLEDRIVVLEQQMAEMQAAANVGVRTKPWLETLGKFEGLKEVFDEAMKLREQDRERARRRFAKKPASANKVKK